MCHEERSAFVPFGGLSKLDGECTSLAFTAREVLSPSRILLGVRDASIGRRERSCHRGECAWSDEGREGGFLSAMLQSANDRFWVETQVSSSVRQ